MDRSYRRKTNGDIPFAKNLKSLMKERNLSQRKLAALAGIRPSTINDWLSGAVPNDLNAVAKLANILQLDFQVLLLGYNPNIQSTSNNVRDFFDIDDDSEFEGVFLIQAKRLKLRKKF